jgi:hypothetical protein
MAFCALKLRDVAKIHRVLERLVCLVTGLAFSVGKSAEIHRMLEPPNLY